MFSKKRKSSAASGDDEFDPVELDAVDDLDKETSVDADIPADEWSADLGEARTDGDNSDTIVSRQEKSTVMRLLPVAAAVVLVLAAGAYFYLNRAPSGPSPTTSDSPAIAEIAVQPTPIGLEPIVASPEVAAPPSQDNVNASTAQPETVSSLVEAPVSEPVTVESSNNNAEPTTPAASDVLPSEQVSIAEAKEQQPSANQPVNASTINNSASQADFLARIEALEARIIQLTQAQDKAPASIVADNIKLVERVASLENQVKDMLGSMNELRKASTAPPGTKESSPVSTGAAEAKTTASPKPEASPPKVATAAKPKPPAPTWVLRAAQPGEAWVSQGMNGDLKRVAVGDTLTGLGKIKDIRQVSGRWVIEGSSNTIQQ